MLTVEYHRDGEIMAEAKNRATTKVLFVGLLAAVVIVVSQGVDVEYWKKKLGTVEVAGQLAEPKSSSVFSSAPIERPLVLLTSQDESLNRELFGLNDRGVSLVLKKKLWEGMYFFEKAIDENPSHIAPVLNMMVVLTEMGLSRPAARYRLLAETINPNHPQLLKILSHEGFVKNPEDVAKQQLRRDDHGITDLIETLEASGGRLWNDGMLMLWGIDSSQVF